MGIQTLVGLAIMPFSVMLARRVGLLWLVCVGASFGGAAKIYFATTGRAVGLFAGQVLLAG
jgi:MFS transporter, SET family, sugar efflux transporter